MERVGCYDDPLPTFSSFLLVTSAAFDSFPTLGNPVLGTYESCHLQLNVDSRSIKCGKTQNVQRSCLCTPKENIQTKINVIRNHAALTCPRLKLQCVFFRAILYLQLQFAVLFFSRHAGILPNHSLLLLSMRPCMSLVIWGSFRTMES